MLVDSILDPNITQASHLLVSKRRGTRVNFEDYMQDQAIGEVTWETSGHWSSSCDS